MRQYQLYYKRLGTKDFAPLQPNVHAPLYGRAEVKAAIAHMRTNPSVEGMAVRIEDEQFNIIASDQEELVPNAFTFGE